MAVDLGNESYVQIQPESTGQKVRTVKLDVAQADGSIATVVMQVMNVRDENGDPIQNNDSGLLDAIYTEIRALRLMYGRATGQSFIGLPAASDDAADF